MKIRDLKIKLLGFCLIVLLMGGCSSSDSVSETSYLDGYVSAKTDISAAGLQVTDTDGNLIAEKNAPATSDCGVFMISVPYLPYEFRVVSSGGMERGENVNYEIMGQFKAFNPDSDTIYLNFVTTLVCVYLDHNPDMSLSESTNAVKAFLGIPAEVDIGRGLYHNDKYFSPVKFMEEAETEGGVSSFMETLVDEIIQDAAAKHVFPPKVNFKVTPVTCAGISLSMAARNGVIAWGAGFALDSMGDLFGMGGPTADDMTEMKNMLINIEKDLTRLSNEIGSAKNEIIAEIKNSEYNIGTLQLADYVTLINNTFTDLKKEISKDVNTLTDGEQTQRINTINYLLGTISDKISPYLGSFHNKVYGDETSDADGLYKIYADKIKAEIRFLTKTNYQDKVKNLLLYYNQIEATELYLAVEYFHATNKSTTIVDTHTQNLGTNSQAEQDWYDSVEKVPEQILLDRDQGLMIYSGEYCYGTKRCPFLGKWREIEKFINIDMCYHYAFGHCNWWWPTVAQINSFFKSCGSENLQQCLERQGWALPDTCFFYFISDYWGDYPCHFGIFGTEAHAWYVFEIPKDFNTGPWNITPVREMVPSCIW